MFKVNVIPTLEEASRKRLIMPSYHTQIGHAHLKVRDLDRSLAFYTRYFNLNVVERVGDHYAFLSGGSMHHEIAIQALGMGALAPAAHAIGLYHVAFEVPDKKSFAQAYQLLQADEIRVGAVDHLISWAMYFNDPDGNGLEIYCDTRDEMGESKLWQGQNVALPDAKILATLE